ncbi:flavodoxin [bacterium]|nr:flavodoxin [bacterium]
MLNNSSKADAKEQEKILVAYFSRTGEQYGVGNIQEGNTAIIAKMIAKKTSGDLFEIKPLKDNYPSKYSSLTQFAKEEKMQNLRPELKDKVENFSKYDTIFIGYPNWWGDMPMPVYTFLESYDFKGKKLYHFCTHEGSGGAKEGLSLYGHTAQNDRIEADKKVTQWLKGLGY